MRSEYYKQLEKLIKNKSARGLIAQELESHIDEKTEYFMEIGYSKEDAEAKAIEAMGDIEDYVVSLAHIHQSTNFQYFMDFLCMASVVFFKILAFIMSFQLGYIPYMWCGTAQELYYTFVSIVALGIFIGILIYSYRYKRKVPVIFMAICLGPSILLILLFALLHGIYYGVWDNISGLGSSTIFQPFWYGIITIFTKGVPEYADTVFSYRNIMDKMEIFSVLSYVTFVVLFIFAVLIIVSIYRQEHMCNAKTLNRILRIIGKVVCTLFACYFAVVSCSTIYAYMHIDEKYKTIEADKKELINLVLNTDVNRKASEVEKELVEKYLMSPVYGNYLKNSSGYIIYVKDSNEIGVDEETKEKTYLSYDSSVHTKAIDNNSYFNWKDFKAYPKGTTLKDFMKTELCYQANSVYHTESGYTFYYYIEGEGINEEYRDYEDTIEISIDFNNKGVLTHNDVVDVLMYYNKLN